MVVDTEALLGQMQAHRYTWDTIVPDLVQLLTPDLELEIQRIDNHSVTATEQVRINKSKQRGLYVNLIKDLLLTEWHWIAIKDILYCYMGNIYVEITKKEFIKLGGRLWAVWQRDYTTKDNAEIYELLVGAVIVPIDKVDTMPDMLPFTNGVMNMATGEWTPYYPDVHLFTRCIAWDYNDTVPCPLFHAAIKQMIPDPIQRDRLLHYMAYCLTTRIDRQFGQIWIGPQGCGKSDLLEGFVEMLGTMAYRISLDALANDKHARYEVRGRRVIWGSEIGGFKISKEKINQVKFIITDGTLDGERKFHDPINFKNTAKLLYTTNDTPIPQSPDDAFWIRWDFIIFALIFRGTDKCIPEYFKRVVFPQERQGIIAYLISLIPSIEKVLTTPRATETKKIWISRSSNALDFINAECDISEPSALMPCTELHGIYAAWCQKEQKDAMTIKTFRKYMEVLGYPVVTAVSSASGNFREHFRGVKHDPGKDPLQADVDRLVAGAPDGSLGVLGDDVFLDHLDKDFKED